VPRDYLTVADVLGMHAVLMQRYGGAPRVRDPGALEAALFRPQTGYYDDVVAEAAALMESLATNHPSVDGDKLSPSLQPTCSCASMAVACIVRRCGFTPRCSRCLKLEPSTSPTSPRGCGLLQYLQSDTYRS